MSGPTPAKVQKLESGDDENEQMSAEETLKNIDLFQSEIEALSSQSANEILKVERKYKKLKFPFYEKRAALLKNLPNFWSKVMINHYYMKTMISEREKDCIRFLDNLTVEDLFPTDDDPYISGCIIRFTFRTNPFFENNVLVKKGNWIEENIYELHKTEIKWKGNMNLVFKQVKSKTEIDDASVTFFSWLQAEGEFNEEDPTCVAIQQDLWHNPMQYYEELGEIESSEMDECQPSASNQRKPCDSEECQLSGTNRSKPPATDEALNGWITAVNRSKIDTKIAEKRTSDVYNTVVVDNKNITVSDNDDLIPEEKTTLSDNKDLISEEKTTVSDNKDLIPEGKTTLPDNKDLISEEKTAVSDNKDLIPEEKTTLSDNKDLISEEKTTLSDSKDLISEEKTTVSDNNDLIPEEKATVSANDGFIVKEKEKTSVSSNEKFISKEKTSVSSNHNLTPKEKTPVSANDELIPNEKTRVSDSDGLILKEKTPVSSNDELIPNEKTAVSDNDGLIPNKVTPASTNDELISTEKDKTSVSTIDEILTIPKHQIAVSTSDELILIPKEKITVSDNQITSETTTVSASENFKEKTSVPDEDL